MNVMLMAAGRGERLRPLTDSCPKPLVPVCGRPLIDYHLEALAEGGFRRVVINLAWLGDQIRDHVGDGAAWGLDVVYSAEGPTGLETGGGIFRALPLLGDEPFLVVNADIYSDIRYGHVRDHWSAAEGVMGHLVLIENPGHNPDGDFSMRRGRVANIKPWPYTYAGVAVLAPVLFKGCRDGRFPLAPLLRQAADQDALDAWHHDGRWHDIGTVDRLRSLERDLGCSDG